jgi:glycine/D-amino acid oxidase-like deaminating enzyme
MRTWMAMDATSYAGLSLWLEQAGDLTPRERLPGDRDVDVAVVGAGFTGLWSAYHLKRADPSLRIAVVEKEIAAYGASGRNGGWCYGHLNGSLERYAARGGRELAVAMKKENQRTVDVIGDALAAEGIDAGFVKGGAITVARTPAEVQSLRSDIAGDRAWGFGEEDVRWLGPDEVADRLRIAGALGGKLELQCARVQPARLARGLARVVEGLGVPIYEQTEVVAIEKGAVRTVHGTLRADVAVRGTEGYTVHIPTEGRRIQPLTSQIIATEPLGPEVFGALGWEGREVFADAVNLGVYCQRTVDDRIAIGGRGGFQPRGGGLDEAAILDPAVFAALGEALGDLLPPARDAAITHRWGGVWGAARDWAPAVGYERERGVAWAGGYGDGVCASNFAARTITDLVLERDSELVRYPWVDHRSPSWPPDPLPRVGAAVMHRAYGAADRVAARSGRPPRWLKIVDRVSGLGAK